MRGTGPGASPTPSAIRSPGMGLQAGAETELLQCGQAALRRCSIYQACRTTLPGLREHPTGPRSKFPSANHHQGVRRRANLEPSSITVSPRPVTTPRSTDVKSADDGEEEVEEEDNHDQNEEEEVNEKKSQASAIILARESNPLSLLQICSRFASQTWHFCETKVP